MVLKTFFSVVLIIINIVYIPPLYYVTDSQDKGMNENFKNLNFAYVIVMFIMMLIVFISFSAVSRGMGGTALEEGESLTRSLLNICFYSAISIIIINGIIELIDYSAKFYIDDSIFKLVNLLTKGIQIITDKIKLIYDKFVDEKIELDDYTNDELMYLFNDNVEEYSIYCDENDENDEHCIKYHYCTNDKVPCFTIEVIINVIIILCYIGLIPFLWKSWMMEPGRYLSTAVGLITHSPIIFGILSAVTTLLILFWWSSLSTAIKQLVISDHVCSDNEYKKWDSIGLLHDNCYNEMFDKIKCETENCEGISLGDSESVEDNKRKCEDQGCKYDADLEMCYFPRKSIQNYSIYKIYEEQKNCIEEQNCNFKIDAEGNMICKSEGMDEDITLLTDSCNGSGLANSICKSSDPTNDINEQLCDSLNDNTTNKESVCKAAAPQCTWYESCLNNREDVFYYPVNNLQYASCSSFKKEYKKDGNDLERRNSSLKIINDLKKNLKKESYKDANIKCLTSDMQSGSCNAASGKCG